MAKCFAQNAHEKKGRHFFVKITVTALFYYACSQLRAGIFL